MTKLELEQRNIELENENNRLYDELDYYRDMEYRALEMEKQVYEIKKQFPIKNWDYFITRMKIENLYTQEFEDFVNDFIKFYND